MIAMNGGVVMILDPGLALKARDGDRDAFAALYEACYPELYRFALYTLGNQEDALDAVSDTFLEAFKGVSNLREPAAFKGWIFRILSVRCKRAVGGLILRRNTFNLDDFVETADRGGVSLEDAAVDNAALAKAIAKLQPEERMILVLNVLHGYTTKEIAEMLAKPQGTVSSKLHRTYGKLRDMLGGEEDG